MQSMSKMINTEALESPLYNPPADKKALMLQEIMETTVIPPTAITTPRKPALIDPESVEFALREHVSTFNNLTVFNPYEGVISNPTTCFIQPIRNELSGAIDYLNGRFSDNGTWTTYRLEFSNDIYGTGSGDGMLDDLDYCQDHTDRLTNNLPSLAGIAQAALALDTVMNLLSNPCLGLDGFLGSIMDKGKALLSSAASKISTMMASARAWADANIGPLIDQIKTAMAQAKAAISQFITAAMAEVMKFAKAMLAAARQGLAELMSNLPQDPCLRGLLGSVATGAAAAVIGG